MSNKLIWSGLVDSNQNVYHVKVFDNLQVYYLTYDADDDEDLEEDIMFWNQAYKDSDSNMLYASALENTLCEFIRKGLLLR